jgi:hypothetical protein
MALLKSESSGGVSEREKKFPSPGAALGHRRDSERGLYNCALHLSTKHADFVWNLNRTAQEFGVKMTKNSAYAK